MFASKSLTGGGVKAFSLPSSCSSSANCIAHLRRMRYSMRIVFFPFSLTGCGSSSSVAVGDTNQTGEPNPKTKETALTKRDVAKQSKSDVKTKNYSASSSIPIPRTGIASRMHRLFRGIKNISQIFVYKEEEEEVEKDMEIGFPTDVKHVTHIGLDGLTPNNIAKVMDDIGAAAAETAQVPTISLDEYEMAMAAQTKPPLHV